MSGTDAPGSEHQCFSGLFARALSAVFAALVSLREVARQNSTREAREKQLVLGPSSNEGKELKDTLSGEAHCQGPQLSISGQCHVRLRADLLLLSGADGGAKEESVQLVGAQIESTGATVTMSRNSSEVLSMTFESEKLANLWATKMAVAGGNAESISKLFSIQRRRIQSLEQHSEDTMINKEEVERCLNFLSREYVEMRGQVRKSPGHQDQSPEPPKLKMADEALTMDMVKAQQLKHQSEPEKEPISVQKEPAESEILGLEVSVPVKGQESSVPGKAGQAASSGTGPSSQKLATSPRPVAQAKQSLVRSSQKQRRATPQPDAARTPVPSPKDRSPHDTRSPLDAYSSIDRRGHKTIMAHQHQRLLARQQLNNQPTRKSVRPSNTPSTSLTSPSAR